VAHNNTDEKVKYISKALSTQSNNLITVTNDNDNQQGGIFVKSQQSTTRKHNKGTMILECTALRIALDPPHRKNYCGNCAKKYSSLRLCSDCQLFAICSSCDDANSCHDKKECLAMKALHEIYAGGGYSETNIVSNSIDSSHLLAVRLFCWQKRVLPIIKKDKYENRSRKLFEYIYELPLFKEGGNALISEISSRLDDIFLHDKKEKEEKRKGQVTHQHVNEKKINYKIEECNFNELSYKQILARVLGCSHAITNVSLPLGKQSLGRALFLHHSFYNHSCTPNAYLSCYYQSSDSKIDHDTSKNHKRRNNKKQEQLIARVHLLESVKEGEPITLSYIPMSGLALQERQQCLLESYGFNCSCTACIDGKLKLPVVKVNDFPIDVDSIRDIQFSCNERLLNVTCNHHHDTTPGTTANSGENDEVSNTISLILMTKRGIKNQNIPMHHEVSIEVDRLLAMAYTILGENANARTHFESFFVKISILGELLFDPVARAIQHLEYSQLLIKTREKHLAKMQRNVALDILANVIGKDHPWIQTLNEENVWEEVIKSTTLTVSIDPHATNKRQRR